MTRPGAVRVIRCARATGGGACADGGEGAGCAARSPCSGAGENGSGAQARDRVARSPGFRGKLAVGDVNGAAKKIRAGWLSEPPAVGTCQLEENQWQVRFGGAPEPPGEVCVGMRSLRPDNRSFCAPPTMNWRQKSVKHPSCQLRLTRNASGHISPRISGVCENSRARTERPRSSLPPIGKLNAQVPNSVQGKLAVRGTFPRKSKCGI